jgi:hypothetical protein
MKQSKYKLVKPASWPFSTVLEIHGCYAGQHLNIFDSFEEFNNTLLKEGILPKTIIEIGTSRGGFSAFLGSHPISDGAEVHTYNIRNELDSISERVLSELNIITHISDIFYFSTQEEVVKLIQRDGTTILFCDNGAKEKEFNIYSKFLKSGDYIFAHDYFKDSATFEQKRNTVWSWHETSLANLNLEKNGVKQVYSQIFDKCVWFCGQKI